MKKIGFTLAELLVAMAIIGVVAAVTLANIHRITPDKDKGMVLKAYKTIMDINKEILEDPSLYLIGTNIEDSYPVRTCEHILACTGEPLDPQYNGNSSYKGKPKYPNLLKDHLVVAEEVSSSNPYRYITADGLDITLDGRDTTFNDIYYLVTVDTRNPTRQECLYNSSSCTNPRLFQFKVNSDGFVEPVDKLSRAYLMNPSELNDREADLQQADQF